VKYVTRDQMRAADRQAIEDYGVPAIVLMENAGRGTAEEVKRLAAERSLDGRTLIVCGGGNNGGDGLVIARHLANGGMNVKIAYVGDRQTADREREAGINLTICERMALPIEDVTGERDTDRLRQQLADAVLVVDALFGVGLSKPPREPHASAIRAIADAGLPVVAVDLPSGLDADTGQPLGEAVIRADVTCTMACPKVGFRKAEDYVGKLVVVDIGMPAMLLRD
jgi:NAD(P)H-hydrate epimerase